MTADDDRYWAMSFREEALLYSHVGARMLRNRRRVKINDNTVKLVVNGRMDS